MYRRVHFYNGFPAPGGEIINNMFSVSNVVSMSKTEEKVLLTLPNIKYLVEGLDALLMMDLDGEKRVKVIQLRDELVSYINSIFNDYS